MEAHDEALPPAGGLHRRHQHAGVVHPGLARGQGLGIGKARQGRGRQGQEGLPGEAVLPPPTPGGEANRVLQAVIGRGAGAGGMAGHREDAESPLPGRVAKDHPLQGPARGRFAQAHRGRPPQEDRQAPIR